MPRKKKIVKEQKPIQIEAEPEESSAIISALMSLKDNPGWQIIKKILDENVFNQERKILNNLYKKELEYNEEDIEKQIRRIYIDLRELPDKEIKRLSGNDVNDEDYDPYYKKLT